MDERKKGSTGNTEYFRMITTSGTPLTAIVVGSAMLAYVRNREAPVNSLMSALGSDGAAHAGFRAYEIYSGMALTSNWAPGLLRVDCPDSAYVTGADKVIFAVTHPLADPAMKEFALVANLEADTYSAVTASLDVRVQSTATQVGSVLTAVGSLATFIQASSLQTGINALTTNLTSVDVRVASAATQVGSVLTAVGSLATFIQASSIQTGVDTLATRVSSVDVRVQSVAVNVGSLATFVQANSVQVQVDSIYGRIGANGINLTSVSGVSGAGLDATQVSSAVWGVNCGGGLLDRLSSLETRVTSIGVNVGSLATFIQASSIQTGVNALTTNLASVDVRVGSAATQVGSVLTAVGSLATFVQASSIQTGVDALATRVSSVDVRVQSVAVNVGSLATFIQASSIQTGVDANAVALSSLHTRVGSAATQVGSVSVGVGSLTGITLAGRMLSDVTAVDSDANAASNVRRGALGAVVGTVLGGSTTTVLSASCVPAAAVADQWKDRPLVFDRYTLTTNLRGQPALINSMTAEGVLSVTALTDAPVSGDMFAVN